MLEVQDSPVQETSQSPSKKRNPKIRREAKDKNAETSAAHAHQQHGFPSNLVAQSSPEDTGAELGEGERRCHHAGIEGDLTLILSDMKVFDHMPDVGENGHEGDGLTYPAKRYGLVRQRSVHDMRKSFL